MADLEDDILENAAGPVEASGDSGSVRQHDLTQQIAADRYINSKRALKNGVGFRLTKLQSPGA